MMRWRRSRRRPGRGSQAGSPRPTRRSSAPGRPSPSDGTRWYSRRPTPARRRPRFTGYFTGHRLGAGCCMSRHVSPLKALAADVERNLRAPLAGIRQAAIRLGRPESAITVGMRTGDTPATERRAFLRTPPDILVTTPKSLFQLLSSTTRESPLGARTVIVNEVSRGGRHRARCASGPVPRPAGRAAWRTGTADRPVRDGSTGRGGKHLPRWRTSVDDRVRQLPPGCRAAHRPAERTGRRAGRGRPADQVPGRGDRRVRDRVRRPHRWWLARAHHGSISREQAIRRTRAGNTANRRQP